MSVHFRRTGRTTQMFIKALVSDKRIVGIVSPTQAMAKYNMSFFVDLIEKITDGRAEIKLNKADMTVRCFGKTFYFLGADNKYSMERFEISTRGITPVAEKFNDHTVYERGLDT